MFTGGFFALNILPLRNPDSPRPPGIAASDQISAHVSGPLFGVALTSPFTPPFEAALVASGMPDGLADGEADASGEGDGVGDGSAVGDGEGDVEGDGSANGDGEVKATGFGLGSWFAAASADLKVKISPQPARNKTTKEIRNSFHFLVNTSKIRSIYLSCLFWTFDLITLLKFHISHLHLHLHPHLNRSIFAVSL